MTTTVLLSASSTATADELRDWLAAAGFAVRGHALGSAPGVDFGPVAVAVIEVSDQANAAVAQTRRWRAELGDELLPIVWILPSENPELAARGLEAGADAVLARPLDAVAFLAQIRAGVRSRTAARRVAARAAEARLLGDQLQKAHAQIDRDLDAARRVQRAFLPRMLPEVGSVRFAVCHRPRGRSGGDFYDVRHLGGPRVGFFLGDVIGSGAVGSLLGVLVQSSVEMRDTPNEMLAGVNRELLRVGLDDQPLVAMLAGSLNAETGELALARAGLPAPVYVPATGEPEVWSIPGPFLGTAETTYPVRTATLRPGDKLLIGTDGTRPDGDPGPADDTRLLLAAATHRELSGQRFVDAVARDLLAAVRHEEDFTLLCVEFTVGG